MYPDFCNQDLKGHDGIHGKTKTIKKELDPCWAEKGLCTQYKAGGGKSDAEFVKVTCTGGTWDTLKKKKICISIWDHDTFSKDDQMGMMSVELRDLAAAAFEQGHAPGDDVVIRDVLLPEKASGNANRFKVEESPGCKHVSGTITVQFNVALLYGS